jgi:hypothetical protein
VVGFSTPYHFSQNTHINGDEPCEHSPSLGNENDTFPSPKVPLQVRLTGTTLPAISITLVIILESGGPLQPFGVASNVFVPVGPVYRCLIVAIYGVGSDILVL